MKTLFRILTILVLFLFVGAPFSEAVSIKPKSQVGEVLHAIGKSKRAFNGGSMAAFYKDLSPRGRRAVAIVVSEAIKEKGHPPAASHVMRALSQVAGTLKLSAHNMTLPEFLDELPKLKERFKSDPQSLEAFNRMLVGLTTNVKQSGVHQLPLFTHALGTSTELADCATLLSGIQRLAPRVGGRKWVEAHCKGVITVGGKSIGMPDDWLLEVKCWRKFKGERALKRLNTQASSTYQRLGGDGLSITFDVSGLVKGPGYVVRFAAAGGDENLKAFEEAIRGGVKGGLTERAIKEYGSKEAIPPEVLQGINIFGDTKVIVEMVK